MHPDVALILPPLVCTNFGRYYPSTAVLGAFLSRNLGVVQLDLNEEFLGSLLGAQHLDQVGRGITLEGRVPADARESASARLLLRNSELVMDGRGRHAPVVSGKNPEHLVHSVAELYRIDRPIAEIAEVSFMETDLAQVYARFFAECRGLDDLPGSLRLVAISAPMGPQLAPALILSRTLRAARPDLRIVLGGPAFSLMHPTDIAHLLRSCRSVDAIVRFEGELPLQSLARQAKRGRWEPGACASTSFLDGDRVVHTAPGPGPQLDTVPHPHYDPALLERLAAPELGIIQARGCYWGKCAYCDYVELYEGSRPYRGRTPKSFADEVDAQVERHGIRRFCLITEALPPALARRMSSELLDRRSSVRWSSFAMVDDDFTPDTLKMMRDAGCEYLVVGVETMTDRVLALVEKAADGASNARFFENCRDVGLPLKVNLIPDLPSTTCHEAMESLAAIRCLSDAFESVSIFPFEATSSSRIGRNPTAYGLRAGEGDEASGQAQFASNHMQYVDPAMTADERHRVREEYLAFAAEVNDRSSLATERGEPPALSDTDSVRLAAKDVDLVQASDRTGDLIAFNWRTERRVRLGHSWKPMMDRLQAGAPLRVREVASAFPSADACLEGVGELLRRRVLLPATSEDR